MIAIKKNILLRGVFSLALVSSIVFSDPVFSTVIVINPLTVKQTAAGVLTNKGKIDIFTRKNSGFKNFSAAAQFNFHPLQFISAKGIQLNIEKKTLNSTALTLNYNKAEDHGTGGSAAFKFSVKDVVKELPDKTKVSGLEIRADVTATVTPGKSKFLPVSVFAAFADPISFSDTDPLATFFSMPEGIEFSPLLDAGYGVDIDTSGLSETVFNMSAHALVGSVVDPDVFAGQVTNEDLLYQLTIKSVFDVILDKQIAIVDLIFNSPIGFLFEVTDAFGMLVDLNDAAGIADIENSIAAAFIEKDGFFGLASSISPFNISLTPTSSVSEYSIGQQGSALISSIEVEAPEPSTLPIFVAGALIMLRRLRPLRPVPDA